jgi:hypothetical protein
VSIALVAKYDDGVQIIAQSAHLGSMVHLAWMTVQNVVVAPRAAAGPSRAFFANQDITIRRTLTIACSASVDSHGAVGLQCVPLAP